MNGIFSIRAWMSSILGKSEPASEMLLTSFIVKIIVETFIPHGEKSSSEVRARPLPGQGFDASIRVECSKQMRREHKPPALFKLTVKPTYRNETMFLYSNWRDPWEIVTKKEAEKFIHSTFGDKAFR